MIKANEVITNAMYLIGIKAVGESLDAGEADIGAEFLGNMLEEWAIKDNINPKISTLSLVSDGKGTYTVGANDPLNDFPVDIMEIVSVRALQGGVVYDLAEITYDEYMAISMKNINGVPTYYSFDYQEPVGNINIYSRPVPGMTLMLIYRPRLTQVINNQTNIMLDRMWKQCLTYNLATRLAPMYPDVAKNLDSTIVYHAKTSYANMRARILKMNTPIARTGYNTSSNGNSWYTSTLNNIGY
jgi:hypothetical protein